MELAVSKASFILGMFFRLFLCAAPFWILGIAIGSAITQVISMEKIKNNPLLYGFKGIFTGALLGVVSPIGLYGGLPIALSLSASAVPAATIFAFLIATPLINPNLFIFTAGVFGFPMAFARLASALLIGILGGCVIRTLGTGPLRFSVPSAIPVNEGKGHCLRSACAATKTRKRGFFPEFYHFLKFSTPYFMIALALATVIETLVPHQLVVSVLGSQNPFSVVIATGLSVPFYLCAGNTIPFIHELVNAGMNQGAALAFFIAGPAAKISNIAILSPVLGARGVLFFLSLSVGSAVLFGYLYGFVHI
jgi:uncharacterized membrane protein YraQ (UPF0718 family)